MEIEYGAEVIDKNGKVLGTVNHVMRNTWTGEISKIMVRREPPERDLFLSPQTVLKTTRSTVKLSVSLDELSAQQ